MEADTTDVKEAPAGTQSASTNGLAFSFVQKVAADLNKEDDLELPGFPDVVNRLQQALADENSSLKDISALINCEPALAARLVQLANSAAFRRNPEPIGELRAAVTLLGMDVVRATATSFAMKQMEQQDWLKPLRNDLRAIWKSSNAVAAAAFTLARTMDGIAPDKAMLAGLFHKLGKLYTLTVAQRSDEKIFSDPEFLEVLDGWHPTIARAILETWRLPEDVAVAVEGQNDLYDGEQNERSPLTVLIASCKYYMDPHHTKRDDELLAKVTFGGRLFMDLVAENKEQIESTMTTFS